MLLWPLAFGKFADFACLGDDGTRGEGIRPVRQVLFPLPLWGRAQRKGDQGDLFAGASHRASPDFGDDDVAGVGAAAEIDAMLPPAVLHQGLGKQG